MIAITDINSIEKIIRAVLVSQSQLDNKFVRNALAVHGEELQKLLDNQIYNSIDTNDTMMLFELRSRRSESDASETNEDSSMSSYKAFQVYVIIYGDGSTNLANKLVPRLRTQAIRETLHRQGIHIESVDEPQKLNEYINETMWIRNDFTIDISCHIKIEQVDTDILLEQINETHTIIIGG